MRRDLELPKFDGDGNYEKEISETDKVGTSVVKLRARDGDRVVSFYYVLKLIAKLSMEPKVHFC